MPERPDALTPESLRALAARFGMTPDAIDEILRGTHEEYSGAGQSLPPVEVKKETPIEEAAALIEAGPASTPLPENPLVAPATPLPKTRVMPVSGGFIAAVFTVLIVALGIAVSFRRGCFEQRRERVSSQPVDTVQSLLNQQTEKASTPPEHPSDVPPNEVPPEALETPPETPNSQQLHHETSRPPHSEPRAPQAMLETTSQFEADEQLAELKADGNTKAHVKAERKHGVTRYKVYTR